MRAALVLLLTSSLLSSGQQALPEPSSQLEGMVVTIGGSEPLAQATVSLHKEGAPHDPAYVARTTAEGSFVLRNIPKGSYRLIVTASGFAPRGYGQDEPNRDGVVLDLTSSQTLKDLLVRMTPGGSISGRAFDQDGHVLEGTVIQLYSRKYRPDGKPTLSAADGAITNDLGEYRLYWIAPGDYVLIASVISEGERAGPLAPRVIDQSAEPLEVFTPTFYPDALDDDHATVVSVAAGAQLRAIDFSLKREKAVAIHGHVIDQETRKAVVGATIAIRPKFIQEPRFVMKTAQTDAQGNFEVRNIAPGGYKMSATMTLPGFRSVFDQQDIQAGDTSRPELQIVLKPSPTITGRLVMENGEATPEDRTALVFNNFASEFDRGAYDAGLANDGTFTVSNILPGVFRLELTGFADNYFIRSAHSGDRDVLGDGLDVTNGSPDSVTVIVASTGGTVEGLVSDEKSAAVAGSAVVLVPSNRGRIGQFKAETTDRSGRFILHGVVPGDYKLFAWTKIEPNIFFDPHFIERYESRGKPIHVDENGHVTADLQIIR